MVSMVTFSNIRCEFRNVTLQRVCVIVYFISDLTADSELILAKVPILKFKDKETGFEIDLNCNNAVGIRNTHLLHCYARLDWRVRPLVVMVKLWAQANNINDAKNMTVSSYSWALMVIHFLQCETFFYNIEFCTTSKIDVYYIEYLSMRELLYNNKILQKL